MPVAAVASMFLSLVFSLGLGQTASLNVLAEPTTTAAYAKVSPQLKAPVGICGVIMTFFDSQGNQLNTNEVWINPGSTTSLALSRPRGMKNNLFYGEVSLDGNSDASCTLLPSLDLTNADGSAGILLPLQRGLTALSTD